MFPLLILIEVCLAQEALEVEFDAPAQSHEADGQKSTSLPRLDNSAYKDQGTVSKLDDLPIYVVGEGAKCIVWNYDIFGFDSGRTRQLCDYFADQGYFVVLPDYYRGTFHDPRNPGGKEFLERESNWDKLYSDWEKVKEYADGQGCTKYGTIGTCWGTYPVVKLSTLEEFSAGVSMHPSHPPVMNILGESEEDLYKEILSPQLFMPSRSDSSSVKIGGLAESILGEELKIIEFPAMDHGWTTRGNLSIPSVDRDVHKAIEEAIKFFNKHL